MSRQFPMTGRFPVFPKHSSLPACWWMAGKGNPRRWQDWVTSAMTSGRLRCSQIQQFTSTERHSTTPTPALPPDWRLKVGKRSEVRGHRRDILEVISRNPCDSRQPSGWRQVQGVGEVADELVPEVNSCVRKDTHHLPRQQLDGPSKQPTSVTAQGRSPALTSPEPLGSSETSYSKFHTWGKQQRMA